MGDGEVQIGKCFRPAGGSALGSPTEAVFEVSEFRTEGSIFTHALLNNLTNLLGSRYPLHSSRYNNILSHLY